MFYELEYEAICRNEEDVVRLTDLLKAEGFNPVTFGKKVSVKEEEMSVNDYIKVATVFQRVVTNEHVLTIKKRGGETS